jgi:fatty acid CoA ligase FadD9
MNPYDDGVSLDVFVDWLIDGGQTITRIDDYQEWLTRFETALTALPEKQRSHTVLPLLHAYRTPQAPLLGAPAPTDVFHTAVRDAGIGPDSDIPSISRELVEKYVTDLQNLGLLSNDSPSTASASKIS